MNSVTLQQAAAAAKQILACYPEIPASDPKAFAAALVANLAIFPPSVINRAVDPVCGIVPKITFLNLAKIRELLDEWANADYETAQRLELANRKALAPAKPDPAADARISKGLDDLVVHLKSGFSPASV